MYEQFGARVAGRDVAFRLFFPDKAVDPSQYDRGDTPHIRSVRALGTFQPALGETSWNVAGGVALERLNDPGAPIADKCLSPRLVVRGSTARVH